MAGSAKGLLGETGDTAGAETGGAAARSRSQRRLPWAVLATALAAGLLVAVVLNLSEPAFRQVAMTPTADDDLDVWLPPEQEAARAGLQPPAPAPEANEFAVEFAAGSDRTLPPAVPVGLVVIAIDGTDERLAIERLVTASGLEVARVDGRIELTGRAAAIDAFLARLERDGWVAAAPEARRQAAGESAARTRGRESRQDAAQPTEPTDRRQLILRLVDRRPPPAEPKAAANNDQP